MRCSTSGSISTLGNGSISWSSKWQTLVTTSTCEAEYVTSCHAMKEAIWLQCLLKNLSHGQPTTTIHSDNAGSIALTKDATFHAHSKHIDVQFHYTWEWVDEKDVIFTYLPTNDMPADIMTKALPHVKHEKFTALLGLDPIKSLWQLTAITVRGSVEIWSTHGPHLCPHLVHWQVDNNQLH